MLSPPDSSAVRWTLVDSLHQQYLHWAGVPIEYDTRPYLEKLRAINAVDVSGLTNAELGARATRAREAARAGQSLDDLLPDVFAIVREAASRTIGLRPFDIQMAAGIALHQGRLAQLATGEGKTLVAVMPVALNALTGRSVHVLTANDYLARRDAAWMAPVYRVFGLEAAHVVQDMTDGDRRRAYAADITYVTAKQAGFDYLRDRIAHDPSQLVQRPFGFVLVDEADFILIDEARVPLVIAGPAPSLDIDHHRIAKAVEQLTARTDFDADQYGRTVFLTDAGLRRVGKLLGRVVRNDARHTLLVSAIHVALHARALLQRDRDYIVRNGRVELVDEWTGRVAANRRWPHGIQPAVEAKEGLEVKPEGRVLGSIPMQHFVRLYPSIAGMTATAVSAAREFDAFFGLTTVVFPPNRTCRRDDEPDVVFTHRAAKMTALADEIASVHATGRPILVGTASVSESEELAATLKQRHVKCRVLNARHDAREALIVAKAGTVGAVTISTNMAGRGVDIVLGGGDPAMHERVTALGGLYVMGTNRHESRRIDDQLRGRAGRQGDPGSSRFFVSLEDDLIKRYGVTDLIPKSHRPLLQDTPVDDPIVAREISRAQRIIEGQNFEIRKTLWEYSQIVDEQRRILHKRRQALFNRDDASSLCAARSPVRYQALVSQVGESETRHAERRLELHLLDRAWSDHLVLIEDIREGIHLQRYGGREPIAEFHRQLATAFSEMMDRVEDETVAAFERFTVIGGRIDLERAGVAGSSTTWTYLINDNPFSNFGLSMLASRNLGVSAATVVLAAMYLPITVLAAAVVFVRRWAARRRKP